MLIDKGLDIQILSESDFSDLIDVDLPKQEDRLPPTLEVVIHEALVEVSEKFGLLINADPMWSVMKMKTKFVVSVWNPLVGFDDGFVDGLGEEGKRLMLETRLSLCQGKEDDRFRAVLRIHKKYTEVADVISPDDEWGG